MNTFFRAFISLNGVHRWVLLTLLILGTPMAWLLTVLREGSAYNASELFRKALI